MTPDFERFRKDYIVLDQQLKWVLGGNEQKRCLRFPMIVESVGRILLLEYNSSTGKNDFRFPTTEKLSTNDRDMNRLMKRRNSAYLRGIATRYIGEYVFGWEYDFEKITAVEPLYVYKDYKGRGKNKDIEYREFPLIVSVSEDPENLQISPHFLSTHPSLVQQSSTLWLPPDEARDCFSEQEDLLDEKYTYKRETMLGSIAMLDAYARLKINNTTI